MGEYEIGRDIQELKSRIERLEGSVGDDSIARRGAGETVAHKLHQPNGTKHPPIAWKAEKRVQLPPFVRGMLPLPAGPQFDFLPESKTWAGSPDLILFITWDGGGEDQFYVLRNQWFSLYKYQAPPTSEQPFVAYAQYTATLQASGKASSFSFGLYVPGGGGRTFRWGGRWIRYFDTSQLHILLRNAQGAALTSFLSPPYSILCQDNYPFTWTWPLDPALYDLADGATWTVEGDQRVNRC